MLVSADIDNSEKAGPKSSFLRIQNIPWSACRIDIKNFLKGLSIKEGGILIRCNEAFVALEDPLDIVVALFQKQRTLHGYILQLSVVSKEELQKILVRKVRRKLDFGQLADFSAKSHVGQRKIRPTPVPKGQKRQALQSLTFLPEEINPPAPLSAVDAGGFHRTLNRIVFGARKMHPTRVSDSADVENFAVFHPEKCYEVQKEKLSLRAVCAFQT